MAVVATAGHVDHGKSALVRALTGMEPDRWAEERRRGMTIDLGYAWFEHAGQTVALVDVPGHERFVGSMLAGVGPAPAVLLVVAADEGWSRQTQEHAAAVAALGGVDLVLAVTRADLADPVAAQQDSYSRLVGLGITPLADLVVSAVTGQGLDALRDALAEVGRRQHEGHDLVGAAAPARLWVDRSFSVSGAGTVVTGTLVTGWVTAGQPAHLGGEQVAVRGLQSHGTAVDTVTAPARLAVNLRSARPEQVHRGDLLTWQPEPRVEVVDVRIRVVPGGAPNAQHVVGGEREVLPGEARNSQHVVGRGRGAEPGEARNSQHVVGGGRGAKVVMHVGTAAVACRIRWLSDEFARITLERPVQLRVGDRGVLRDPGRQQVLAGATVLAVDPPAFARRGAAAARAAALAEDTLTAHTTAATPTATPSTPPDEPGLAHLLAWLADHPLDAPLADQVSAWAPSPRALAEAATAGRLVRHSGLLLHPDVHAAALRVFATLEAPFTVGEATRALGTTRRVSVPVLERLDALGHTQREPDGRRRVVGGPVPTPP